MGIQGLLKQLEPLAEPIDVGLVYRGKTVAVDTSVWLHKGAYGCAPDLVLDKHTTGYIAYVLARALALRRRGVNVLCVFDGPRTELKAETSSQRRSSREEYITQGLDALERSKQTTDPAEQASLKTSADEFFRKGVSVTQEMTTKTIAALRALGFATIVSPSEADVQLAHLCATGEADAVLTEDSDVIVYSAACGVHFPVLYKFDHHAQVAQQISLDPAQIQKAATEASANGKANSFVGSLAQLLQNDLLRRAFPQICVLAGCDYVSNHPGNRHHDRAAAAVQAPKHGARRSVAGDLAAPAGQTQGDP